MLSPLTTKVLFPTYPREFGDKRILVHNVNELQHLISLNSGNSPCFISGYRLSTFICEIDKIIYDFDGKLDDFIDFYKIVKQYYPVIPVITGKKGFHAHILLKPMRYPFPLSKELLYNATIYILNLCFKEVPLSIDRHIIGNIRQMIRLPESLREDKRNYCSYLPSYFDELTDQEIYGYMKYLHTGIKLTLKPRTHTLYDFPIVSDVNFQPDYGTRGDTQVHCEELKNLLRPCLYRHLTTYLEPCNVARLASALDLLQFNSVDAITELFSQLGWRDFDRKTTIYQINYAKQNYKPYGCKKLREKGIPLRCCVE